MDNLEEVEQEKNPSRQPSSKKKYIFIAAIIAVIVGAVILVLLLQKEAPSQAPEVINPDIITQDEVENLQAYSNDELDYSFDIRPEFVCPIVGFGEWKEAIPTPTDQRWCSHYSEGNDLYWWQRAKVEKDQRYCSLVDFDRHRRICYREVAVLKGDPRICKPAIYQWNCETSLHESIEAGLKSAADKVMRALENKDMQALSELIHPAKGVYFSVGLNYETLAIANRHFTKDELADASIMTEKQLFWTRGDAISFEDFFDQSVYYSYSDSSKIRPLSFYPMVGRINRDGSAFLLNPGGGATYEIPAFDNPAQVFSTTNLLLFELYENKWFLIATSQGVFDIGDTLDGP